MRQLLLLTSLILTAPVLSSQTVAEETEVTLESALKTITEDDCYDLVQVLAATDMAGRGTLTPGFERAAKFVETQLETLGYTPANGESYRVPFSLNCIVAGKGTHFKITGLGDGPQALEVEKDFVPILGSLEEDAWGEAVFVGYAIDAKKEKWSDLKKKEVRDKIVFAFTREPFADNPKARKFDGVDSTRHSEIRMKAKAVADAGGLALVLVPDPGMVASDEEPVPGMSPFVDARGAGPVGMQQVLGMPRLPVLSVSRAVASQIFDEDFTAYYKSLEKKKKPKLLKAKEEVKIDVKVEWATAGRDAYNLGALLKGSGDSGELVVLGAHLDHVGFDVTADQMRFQIRPGADDNASGSAALMEVAEALAGSKPQVDILFLWFTGEELGLLGSSQYCEDPLFPHENTIAMFNMDMVGRGDGKKINIGGLWDRPGWEKLVKDQHKRIRSKLKMDNKQGRDLYARSDQYSFHQQGVVGLFFFEADLNSNKTYHQPGDVAETIDGKKMAAIAKLFTACIWAVAYEGERP
ncbi:MAG: M28 family peptidase [Planctomycetota bacterium]|jgi:hypothetical protein